MSATNTRHRTYTEHHHRQGPSHSPAEAAATVAPRRKVRRLGTADGDLPLWTRPSLRRGLPGDGRPSSRRDAYARCPHSILRHKVMPDPQYGHVGVVIVHSYVDPVGIGPHLCIGEWQL